MAIASVAGVIYLLANGVSIDLPFGAAIIALIAYFLYRRPVITLAAVANLAFVVFYFWAIISLLGALEFLGALRIVIGILLIFSSAVVCPWMANKIYGSFDTKIKAEKTRICNEENYPG